MGQVDMTFVTTDVVGGTWLEWGDSIQNVKDMVDQAIAKLGPDDCIGRLIICSHGAEHTDGFAAFDAETSGVEVIDGSMKTRSPLSDTVREQLGRLRGRFCPGAMIEFRVCRFGAGENGARALQAISDLLGVEVTGPQDSIQGIALWGGVATRWTTVHPSTWGAPATDSFFRGEHRPSARPPADIADVPRYIPMPGVPPPAPPGPAVVPPEIVQKIKEQTGAKGSRPIGRARPAVIAGGVLVLAMAATGITLARSFGLSSIGVGPSTDAPSVPAVVSPTSGPTGPAPAAAEVTPVVTVTPTPAPTPTPSATPTPSPSPSPTPTLLPATPEPTPEPTQAAAVVPVAPAPTPTTLPFATCVVTRTCVITFTGFRVGAILDWLDGYTEVMSTSPYRANPVIWNADKPDPYYKLLKIDGVDYYQPIHMLQPTPTPVRTATPTPRPVASPSASAAPSPTRTP